MTGNTPYAEVIGDPVDHSKSPLIHQRWLKDRGITGDYLRTRVPPTELAAFLRGRQSDPLWRGCNVTIPHKETILGHLDQVDEDALRIGAVNCIVHSKRGLVGSNTDIDGVAAALANLDLRGSTAVMVGAGGAARAASAYLANCGLRQLVVLVRDPEKAESLRPLVPGTELLVAPLMIVHLPDPAPALVINASPLGMAGQPEMPPAMLENLSRCAPGALFFDMVYSPLETSFIKAGGARGARVADGLTMLVGQAARAFELFFGMPAPNPDAQLRSLLST